MINPNRYKWKDTAIHITNANIDTVKLERVAELAAMKIYPVFTAYNLEMGDRTPTLQYLTQIIFELCAGAIDNPADGYSWGGISIEGCQWGETDDDYFGINIEYHLGYTDFTDVTK